jgi:Uma2 family endonuclease
MGRYSVPEPDVALVPGRYEDYDDAHPRSAILVVEVADSSLEQDRLTKAMIYAIAEVPEYRIVNVVDLLPTRAA